MTMHVDSHESGVESNSPARVSARLLATLNPRLLTSGREGVR
jgi:hypothetical protein